MKMRASVYALCGLALLLVGCDSSQTVPIEEVDEPVAYVGRPPGGIATALAEAVSWRASSWSDEELFLLDASSGETWQLTSTGSNLWQPTWSPSGTHLMYLSLQVRPFGRPNVRKLFVHSLKRGTARQVDLSWALESGPAAPEIPKRNALQLGWLECAAWSPIDTTKIAVGVTVDGPSTENPFEDQERRIVLLDTQNQTGRTLARYEDLCGELSWSPEGKYIDVGLEEFDLLKVDTGETISFAREYVVEGDSLQHHASIGWGWKEGSILVRVFSFEVDKYSVHKYNVGKKEWSGSMGVFSFPSKVVSNAPVRPPGIDESFLDFIILRDSLDTSYSDLWRYRRPEGTYERLTADRMPKQDVVPYHGGVRRKKNHP
jgi:hypothetical protein